MRGCWANYRSWGLAAQEVAPHTTEHTFSNTVVLFYTIVQNSKNTVFIGNDDLQFALIYNLLNFFFVARHLQLQTFLEFQIGLVRIHSLRDATVSLYLLNCLNRRNWFQYICVLSLNTQCVAWAVL